MNDSEALRVVAMLTAYFRAEVGEETAVLWAETVRNYEQRDALEAARELGLAGRFMPSLSEFRDAIVEVRNERLRAEVPRLPAGNEESMGLAEWFRTRATPHERDVARRLFPKLMRKLALPLELIEGDRD